MSLRDISAWRCRTITTLSRRGRAFAGRQAGVQAGTGPVHLVLDSTGEITAHVLTDGDADHAVQAPVLLRQYDGTRASLTADGAYDRDPVCEAAAARQPGSPPKRVIPPRADAGRARLIRIGRQRATGYGRRSHAETTMSQYKHLIGPKLRARSRSAQHGEVALSVQVLNRMIRKATPVSGRR